MNKTHIKKDTFNAKWFFVDADDQTLGRLSSQIASYLKNKNSIYFTPFQISRSHIIVINAKKIKISGQKKYQKLYKRHSGRPGGLKVETFTQLQNRLPARIIEKAVKGMLPKNTLGRKLFKYLKVYDGPNHPHSAQKPIPLPIHK
uniref:50S ribosomal protein L13 n=1 Tax=Porolithon onkodes TaxID=231751 RepID=A0A2Z2KVE5_9FLOR|nr:50S ribosomal protein L13 [Porolithon onkodes]ASB29697.1 50S ribosomal protein L13 [Porolithon onkodes]